MKSIPECLAAWPVEPNAARLPRRNFLRLIGGSAAFQALTAAQAADAFPARPITLVVPFAAGGGTDVIGRILADRMRTSLGQPVVVENVTGAAGNIGVGRVAHAAPDGYTIVMGIWNTHVANAALYELQFDVLEDFEPIALISDTPMIVVGRKGIPANDLPALVAWLKENRAGATAATAGVGSAEHLAAVLFENLIGARLVFVPYRGSAPAMNDLVAGHIDIMIAPSVPTLPQVRAGTIKAYAVTSPERLPAAPTIPTVDEAHLPGFHFSLWTSLWGPKGLPPAVASKLNAAVREALDDPVTRQRLSEIGPLIVPPERQSPEALRSLQKLELEKWLPIIRASNVKGP